MDRRRPQKVELLVEVPNVVSFSSLQPQTAEQNIDIPVPRTRGDHEGLQGFLPGQVSSRRTVEQFVDIPVPGEGPDYGRLQDFHPGQGHTQRSAAQNPVPGGKRATGGPEGSVPGQSSSAFRGAARRGFHQGFFPEQSPAACVGGQQDFLLEQMQQRLLQFLKVLLQHQFQHLMLELTSLVTVSRALSPDRVQQRIVEQTLVPGVSARASSRRTRVRLWRWVHVRALTG